MRLISISLIVLMAGCTMPASSDGNRSSDASGAVNESVDSGNGAAQAGNDVAAAPARQDGRREDQPIAAPASAPGDACRSRQYRHLVGKHRSQIPARPEGETWRVTCTACPMTMDYSERRLNILYDRQSGIVEDVRCG